MGGDRNLPLANPKNVIGKLFLKPIDQDMPMACPYIMRERKHIHLIGFELFISQCLFYYNLCKRLSATIRRNQKWHNGFFWVFL